MKHSVLFRGLALAGLLSLGAAAQAADNGGVQLSGTRLIFDGSKDAASMTVTNASAKDVWLMRFWVSPYDEKSDSNPDKKAAVPFAVTPPLHRLDPKGAVQLRVNKLTDSLPADREAVYYLNSLAIPPKKGEKTYQKAVQSGMQFAVNTRIKLFWRPAAISDAAAVKRAPEQVTLSASGKTLSIRNPTPYHLTMGQLAVNGKTVQVNGDSMIAPFGELQVPVSAAHGTLSYSTIDDRGMTTPALKKTF